MRPLALVVGLMGCQPLSPKPDSGVLRFESEDPTLTGLSLTCDQTDGRWSVALRADAWVGTARLWMATRPEAIERHDLEVDYSAADATWDCFDSTIQMAADLGDPGSNTRYRCAQRTDVHMLLAISDADSETWTDCRTWGPEGVSPWADDSSVPSCSTVLDDVFADNAATYETGDVAACN